MSSAIFDTIVPTTTSGNQLATILNSFKDAVVSGFSGSSRPSQLQPGGYWVDTTLDPSGLWSFKIYDGVQDITVFTLNKNTGLASIASADSLFEIQKISSDSLGAIARLRKKRVSNNGQTLNGDTVGEIQFNGTRDDGNSALMARVKALSSNDVTTLQQGAYMVFEITTKDGTSISEVMRLVDDKLVIGSTIAEDSLHVVGSGIRSEQISDTPTGAKVNLRKKRISASGQVLNGDVVGEVNFNSTDSVGEETPTAKIEVQATESHTNSAHGSKISFKNKKIGQTELVEQFVIGEGVRSKSNFVAESGASVSGGLSTDSLNVTQSADIAGSLTVGGDLTITGNSAFLKKDGSTPMTGDLNLSNNKVTGLADPVNPTDAVNKRTLDSVSAGLSVKPAVKAATISPLTGTYYNGPLNNGVGATFNLGKIGANDIDGVVEWAINDGILLKDQPNQAHNGRYYVSQIGSLTVDWILTRCTSCDEPSEIPGAFVFVQYGNINAGSGFVATVGVVSGNNSSTFEVGIDDIFINKFSEHSIYLEGTGIQIQDNSISILKDDITIGTNVYGELAVITPNSQGFITNIDWGSTNLFYSNLSTNTTLTFSSIVDGKTISVAIKNTSASDITITLPTVIKSSSFVNTVRAGKETVFTFMRINGKTYASSIGDMS